jgi:anti-anti-sigma factor
MCTRRQRQENHMARTESSSVSVPQRGFAAPGLDREAIIIWVRGEHDIATRAGLSQAITDAAALDDADVFVDLSAVTFMDASTVGTIVGGRNLLRSFSRSLAVRAPSVRARRVLDLCGLAHLVQHEAVHPAGTSAALGTWVDVPAIGRLDEPDRQAGDSAPPNTTRPAPAVRAPHHDDATLEALVESGPHRRGP